MTTKKLITSDDPKGRDATAKWRGVYDKAELKDNDGPQLGSAQRLNESKEFWKELGVLIQKHSTANKYVNQVVKSNYTYPSEFQRKPEKLQVEILAKKLGLDPKPALEYLKTIAGIPSILPSGCHPQDGNYAILSPFGLMKIVKGYDDPSDVDFSDMDHFYCNGLLHLFEIISEERTFTNYREGQINKNHLRQTVRTLEVWRTIANTQGESPIWIVPAQLGFLHKGESVNRAREIFMINEFGLGSVAGASIVITHPKRFIRSAGLDMDLPGDEFSPAAIDLFSRAPILSFDGDEVDFTTFDVSDAPAHSGSASAFLPKL